MTREEKKMENISQINRVRAQFLLQCPEQEQMRRVIKPYIPNDAMGSETIEQSIRQFYASHNGDNVLDSLESPPISSNFLDNYATINKSRMAKDRGYGGSKMQEPDAQDEFDEKLIKELSINKNEDKSSISISQDEKSHSEKSNIEDNSNSRSNNQSISTTSITTLSTHSNNTSHHDNGGVFSSMNSKTNTNETLKEKDNAQNYSGIQDSTKSKRGIRFARLFRNNKREESGHGNNLLNHKNDSTSSHNIAGQQTNNYSNKGSNTVQNKRQSIFEMNFDYDEPEEDEDEDDDEQDVESGDAFEDAQDESGVETVIEKDEDVNSSFTSNNKRPSLAKLRNTSHDQHTGENLQRLNSQKINVDDNEDDMLDIYSLMNEGVLDQLNLGDETGSLSTNSYHKDEPISGTPPIISDDDRPLDPMDSSSSFSKSLIYSDFSNENNFGKAPGLENNDVDLNSSLSSDINQMPTFLDSYGMYHAQDESMIDNAFDKAAKKIKTNLILGDKNSPSELESLASYTSDINVHSRKSSLSIAKVGMSHHHSRSHSSVGGGPRDYRKIFKGLGRSNIDESNNSQGSSRKNSESNISSINNTLDISKQSSQPAVSQLSLLFNKKKSNKKQDLSEILEYFSFVSGSKVPRIESLDIFVYIRSSKTFAHDPFKINIRKTASVFEVIGFILYKFSTEFKPKDFLEDGIKANLLRNPNNFALHIVEEDGEPFEDNFGKLDRKIAIQSISDNEVVLCEVNDSERNDNSIQTPLPYDLNGDIIDNTGSETDTNDYYRSSISNVSSNNTFSQHGTTEIKVYLYPEISHGYTIIKVSMTSTINEILVRFCKIRNIDPVEYSVILLKSKLILDLNDTVMVLNGQTEVEIISKKDTKSLHLQKMRNDILKHTLPTIQSNNLTPLTLDVGNSYLKADVNDDETINQRSNSVQSTPEKSKRSKKFKKQTSKMKLNLNSSNNALFKSKNSSKGSLHKPIPFYHSTDFQDMQNLDNYDPGLSSAYQDLISGAYHKYHVWRRQQMSLINKHERTLALDGDYIYIIPPDKQMHWRENVKTKSIHISRIILVKRSNRAQVNFKFFIRKADDSIKRYYFEAESPEQCKEIVARIKNLCSAYKMNHK